MSKFLKIGVIVYLFIFSLPTYAQVDNQENEQTISDTDMSVEKVASAWGSEIKGFYLELIITVLTIVGTGLVGGGLYHSIKHYYDMKIIKQKKLAEMYRVIAKYEDWNETLFTAVGERELNDIFRRISASRKITTLIKVYFENEMGNFLTLFEDADSAHREFMTKLNDAFIKYKKEMPRDKTEEFIDEQRKVIRKLYAVLNKLSREMEVVAQDLRRSWWQHLKDKLRNFIK